MSNYYDEKAKTTSTEEVALQKFKEFAEQSSFLLAHNAEYDMKMVNVRMKKYGIQTIKEIPVLDSLAFSRRFFIPL
jgi:DNA polymerase III alpha subunit (gram-positive type)